VEVVAAANWEVAELGVATLEAAKEEASQVELLAWVKEAALEEVKVAVKALVLMAPAAEEARALGWAVGGREVMDLVVAAAVGKTAPGEAAVMALENMVLGGGGEEENMAEEEVVAVEAPVAMGEAYSAGAE
jgi:hypothetical protein